MGNADHQGKENTVVHYSTRARLLCAAGYAGIALGLSIFVSAAFYELVNIPVPLMPPHISRVEQIRKELPEAYHQPLTLQYFVDPAFRDSLDNRVFTLKKELAEIEDSPQYRHEKEDFRESMQDFRIRDKVAGQIAVGGLLFTIISGCPFWLGRSIKRREDTARLLAKR